MPAAETPISTPVLPDPSRKFRILPSAETIRASRFLLRDAVWRYKGKVSLIVALGFLAPLLQVGLFLLLFKIVSAGVSQTITLEFLHWSGRFEMSPKELVVSAVTVALALGVVAVLIYFVKSASLGLAERYQMFSGKNALSLLFTREELNVPPDSGMQARQYLSRAVRVDARLIGRSFAQLLYLPIPLVSCVVYFCVLIYLDPRLTAILALIMPIVGIAQLVVIRRAAHISEDLEVVAPKVNTEIGNLISARSRSTGSVRDPGKFLDDALIGAVHFRNFLSMRIEMLTLPARAQMVNDVFSAVTIAIVIGTFAWGIGFKVGRLAEIAAYLLVLRMVSANAKSVAGIVTILNKFMPQTRRFIEFMVNNPAEGTDQRSIIPAPPALVSLVMLEDLHRYNASHVASQMFGITPDEKSRVHAAIVDPRTLAPPEMPLRTLFDMAEDTKIHSLISAAWGEDCAKSFPALIENATCSEVVEKLTEKQILELLIAVEFDRKPTALFLPEEDLSLLAPEEADDVLKISSRIATVVIQDAPYRRVGALDEQRIVTIQDDVLTGDYTREEFQQRKKGLLAELREARAAKRAAEKRSGADEEEEFENNEI